MLNKINGHYTDNHKEESAERYMKYPKVSIP